MSAPKRKRSANWMASEKSLLVDLVAKHFGIIENKKTDGTTLRQKSEEWKIIAQEYNLQTALVHRLAENLKAQWEAMKKAAKKEASELRMAMLKTGGGQVLLKKEDPCTNRILSLISTSAVGLFNPNDSDAILPAVPTQEEQGSLEATITPVQGVEIPQSPLIIIEDNSALPMDDVTMSGCETQTQVINQFISTFKHCLPIIVGLFNPNDSDAILPAVPTQEEQGSLEATITPVQGVEIPQSPLIIIEDNSALPMDDVTMSGCETQTQDPLTPLSVLLKIPETNNTQEVKKDWGDYSPQLLRTPVSASLKTSDKKSGISRRRPEHNSTTTSLEMLHKNKIEALHFQKNIAAEEAYQNKLIAQIDLDIKNEILKQEKIKTKLLMLELKQKQKEYQEENDENSEDEV